MKPSSLKPALVVAIVAATTALVAEDTFYVQEVAGLNFTEGSLPDVSRETVPWRFRLRHSAMRPYVVLQGEGEAYLTGTAPHEIAPGRPIGAVLSVRAPAGDDVLGQLFWPKGDASGMVARAFTIPARLGSPDHRSRFLEGKREHYEALLWRDIPGTAWFRHQAGLAREELGLSAGPRGNEGWRSFRGRIRSVEDTVELFSGGRALSENLQLDRILPTSKAGDETVAIDSIPGITVREFDWKPLVAELDPKRDSLAELIPADQHALFFPSFAAMAAVADDAGTHGDPVLNFAEPRSEDARSRARYERQLGLSLHGGARLIGPRLVKSVAMTGADPYLRTGADIAILLEATNTAALRQLVEAQVRHAATREPRATSVEGAIDGVEYSGVRTLDRRVSSYIATLQGAVVVTNSLAQLARLVDVQEGRAEALASLPEYTFFRERYRLGDEGESALLLISDRTIRRWCGPRWRIGASRRTRALAFMTDLQAAYLDDLVDGETEPEPLYRPDLEPVAGTLTVTPDGVLSSVYGSLEFQTPIVELDIESVTKQEADLYARWRDGYQRRWSNFFDPIAVRFHVDAKTLSTDVTVLPLIAGTEYREFIDITRGTKIGKNAGDPHRGSLLHLAMAINQDSPRVRALTGFVRGTAPQIDVDPLSWIGETLALYADQDPVWEELADAEKFDRFLERNWPRLPVALHVEVRSGFKLAAFLAGLRVFVDQSAPGMTVWETREHQKQPYVRVAPSARARSDVPDGFEDVALYYSASGSALIVTLDEALLKRAIEREVARSAAEESGEPAASIGRSWIGESLCLQLDTEVIKLLEAAFGQDYQQAMQVLSWSNLEILNEWRRLYPRQDPVALHERFWQRRLVCPGGGEYRWNDRWKTMESSVYGHPGEPKTGAGLPAALGAITHGNFGVTFEESGLRAAVELERRESN